MMNDEGRRSVGAWLMKGFNALVYLIVALPAVVIVVASLNASNALTLPPTGLSLEWYRKAFANDAMMSGLLVSLELATFATFFALLLGIPAAYALARYEFPGRGTIQAMLLSPFILPAIIVAIGMLQMLSMLGLNRSLVGLVLGHLAATLPYVVKNMTVVFMTFDPTYEQAARNLRANSWRTLVSVTLPMLFPGVLASALFAFVISFGNLTISMFLAGTGTSTLPVQMFSYVDQSIDPIIAAVSSIVIFITTILISAAGRVAGSQRSL
jgi:putative spermidine/putrescine transport system permease protein